MDSGVNIILWTRVRECPNFLLKEVQKSPIGKNPRGSKILSASFKIGNQNSKNEHCAYSLTIMVNLVLTLTHAFTMFLTQDDMHLRVYNYNTLERVNQFEAHSDYLRSIAIHPTQPYILSSSGKLVMVLTFLFVVSNCGILKTDTLWVMQKRERND